MQRLTRLIVSALLIVSSLLIGALPVAAQGAVAAQGDIVDIAVADGRFTTLVAAVQQAGLVDTLKGPGPYTVFAPIDDAFAGLPEGLVPALLNDVPALSDILLYHVVEGKVMAADVVELSEATTVLGQPIRIQVEGDSVMLNGSVKVILTDIVASNGVIHVIDSVLVPEFELAPGDYLVKPGDTLGSIAQTLLGSASRYLEIVELTNEKHAVDAAYAFIEDPNLIRINWKLAVPTIQVSPATAQAVAQSIVDLVLANNRFATLVTALTKAGLVDTLAGPGPYTLLLPTDEAFAKLPAGTIEALLNDIPALTDILLYHVIPGQVPAATVVTLESADTALGVPVTITVEGDKVMINDATVLTTDVEASNGLIHVIDTVLLPPES